MRSSSRPCRPWFSRGGPINAKPIPLLSLAKQHRTLSRRLRRAVIGVLDSGAFIQGPEGRAFELEFSKALGLARVLGVDSGTSALELALKACGVGPGDEVVVPTFTFIATATAVSAIGATPIMADVDQATLTLGASQIEAVLSPRTKAVVPVHLYGQPAEMAGIMRLARSRGLRVVEDCAQAHLAVYKGRPAGSWGDIAAFSFYPSKNLGAAGDAGAVATADAGLAAACEELRNCGRQPGASYSHVRIGYNCRLDEMQAAILRVKLRKLAAWTARRRALASFYAQRLSGLPLRLPPIGSAKTRSSFHLYVVRTPKRDALAAFLRERGIGSGVYYPVPVHQQPAYAGFKGVAGSFPIAERACAEVLALPLYPELTRAEAARVVNAVREFFRS